MFLLLLGFMLLLHRLVEFGDSSAQLVCRSDIVPAARESGLRLKVDRSRDGQ